MNNNALNLPLSLEMLQAIDKARGQKTRDEWVQEAIGQRLEKIELCTVSTCGRPSVNEPSDPWAYCAKHQPTEGK